MVTLSAARVFACVVRAFLNAHVRAELAQVRQMIAQLQQRIAELEQRQRPQPSGTDATGGASDTTTDYVGGKIRGGR